MINLHRVLFIVSFLALMAACSDDDTPVVPKPEQQHTEAVSELIRLMDGTPAYANGIVNPAARDQRLTFDRH